MLTPQDKVRSGVNDIIQIIVTTRCDLFTCSNCTQLLPFRQDAQFMSLNVFQKALKSLKGWPGVVSLFGGNPCSHPQFDELCDLLAEHFPQNQRGLWTNNLLGKGAIARRTFYPDGRFNLNVHRNVQAAVEMGEWLPGQLIRASVRKASHHAPILMHWADLGMAKGDWDIVRESCDINQKWSGAIKEHLGKPVAYFCEVAAAIDGVRGVCNGIPAVEGWWQKPIDEFSHQISNCCDEGCGVPLRLNGHDDGEQMYDITRSWIPLTALKEKRPVNIIIHEDPPDQCKETTDYLRMRSE